MQDKDIQEENTKLDESTEKDFQDLEFVESTEDGDVLPTKDIVKKIRDDLQKARADKEEYLTGWQRAKADYVNLQKEMNELRLSSAVITKERMMKGLLPALDSFDMAFANKDAWEKVDSNWRQGIEYIYSQLMTGLSDSSIERINEVGVLFDPTIHQAMETIITEDATQDHKIEKIIQVGYKMGDRVIRPARVNVFEYKNN